MFLDGVLQMLAATATLAGGGGAPGASHPPQALVRVTVPVAVRDAPGGRRVARLGTRTTFGSPTIVPVVGRRGRWLRVLTAARPSGEPAWVRDDARLRPASTQVRLRADLRAGRLIVAGDGWRVRFGLSSGRPSTPTPPGRYAVTDRIDGRAYRGTYGLAVLALSGNQPNVLTGWAGGTRLAIHGRPGGGRSPSLGCLVVSRGALAWLRTHVPLGAVVTVAG